VSRPTLYRLPVARGNTAAGIYLGAIGAVAGIVFVSIWMTTQVTAYRLHFHPALGASLFTIGSPYRELLGPSAILAATLGVGGLIMPSWRSTATMLFMLAAGLLALRVGPLYAPLNFFIWWWRFGDVRGTEEVWRQGAWMVSVPSHAAVFVAIIVAVKRARRLTGPTDTHGSARWATRADLHASGLVGRNGDVYVGAWPAERETVYLRHDGPQHVLAFAPSRSGKGVGLVLPTLLSWPTSVVVNDIKGENWPRSSSRTRPRSSPS